MDNTSTESEKILPRAHSPSPGICDQNDGERGNSEMQISSLPGQTFQCAQEGLKREKSNPRPVTTEYTHQMRQIQNDNRESSPLPASPGRICMFYRHVRCVLAPSSCRPVPAVPGFCSGETNLPLQSGSLRVKHRPKNLHKVSPGGRKATQTSGSATSRLPRRLADLGGDRGKMQGVSKHSIKKTTGPRIPDQLEEVPATTIQDLRMVGPHLGPEEVPDQNPHSTKKTSRDSSKENHEISEMLKEIFGESSGVPSLCLSDRSDPEGEIEGHQPHLEVPCKTQTKRQTETYSESFKDNTSPLVIRGSIQEVDPSPSPTHFSHHPHGCLSDGMGRLLGSENRKRVLVQPLQDFPHKLPRTYGSSPRSEEIETSQELPHTPSAGQSNSSKLLEERGLPITPPQPCSPGNSVPSEEEVMVSDSVSSGGSPECDSRRSFEGFTPRDRMVSLLAIIRRDNELNSRPRNRPIRDKPQPQTTSVCHSRHGSHGSGNRCIQSGLEQMEEDIPIPSNQHSPEGSGEIEGLQGHSSSRSPTMAQQPLVPSPHGVEPIEDPILQPSTLTDDPKREDLRLLSSDNPPSYMDYLSRVLTREFSKENVEIMLEYLKPSSISQYSSVWSKWTSYLNQSKPKELTHNTVISFLRYLFVDRGLSPATISSHRSVLSQPLLRGFGIDLNTNIDAMVTKAFFRKRPRQPQTNISWSLNKVLEHLEQESSHNSSIKFILHKSIFLLALASGARGSEIAALTRDPQYLSFTTDGGLRLRPNPQFIAKNELPDRRWDHWVIPALPDGDNPLCPVRSLSAYMDLTKSLTSGPLFRCHSSDRPLTTAGIRSAMTSLIKISNPDSVPKSHDIRKLASSYAFMEGMNVTEMANFTGWAGSKVFLRHYLKEINDLQQGCVAMGRVVSR